MFRKDIRIFQALEGVKVRLERVVCFCNPKHCTWNTCKIKFKSRQIANFNILATLKTKHTVLDYNVKAYYQFSNNEYRPILLDVTDEYCSSLSGSSGSIFMSAVNRAWGNKSNIFQPCPYLPGEYFVKDWNLDASHLPSIIPAGRYLIKVIFRTEFHDLLYNMSVYFNVANHGVLDLGMG